MAKKHTKTEFKWQPTKHQLSRWQRQQRIQRIIIIVGSVFFALVLGFVGYGYYNEQVKPLRQPVVKINDTVFDMDYYLKILDVSSQEKEAAETADIADDVIEIIETAELVRELSTDLGYSVSEDEVSSGLEGLGFPDDKAHRDVVSTRLLVAKLIQGYFAPKVPTECEQVHAQAMFLESNEVAKKVAERLQTGDNFTALAKEYSLEALTKEAGGDLGWMSKEFAYVFLGSLGDSLLKDIPFSLEPGVISEPTYDGSVTKGLGYWLVEVTEKDAQRGNHARGILLGSLQEAEEIRARIEAGEDFGALAKEYSQDSASKEQGGDLGWTAEGAITNRLVMTIAMQTEPGVVSEPTADKSVQTTGGYWLVRVVEKDDSRAFDDDTRSALQLTLFDELLLEKRADNSMEVYLTEEQKSWALMRVLKSRE